MRGHEIFLVRPESVNLMMADQVRTCKSCGHDFEGHYCNRCGEKLFHEKDKHIGHLFEEQFHFITHFEGSFFNTIKTVLARPGQLTLDYCNGIRKKYFKPVCGVYQAAQPYISTPDIILLYLFRYSIGVSPVIFLNTSRKALVSV